MNYFLAIYEPTTDLNFIEKNKLEEYEEDAKSGENKSEESKHYDEISKVIEHTTTKIITSKKKLIQDSFENPVRYKNSKTQINKNLGKSTNSIISREIEQMLEESKLMQEPEVRNVKDTGYRYKEKDSSSDNIFKD